VSANWLYPSHPKCTAKGTLSRGLICSLSNRDWPLGQRSDAVRLDCFTFSASCPILFRLAPKAAVRDCVLIDRNRRSPAWRR
jgi:hypothetical protein